MATAVGSVRAPLIDTAKGLHKSIKRLHLDPQRRNHFTTLLDRLLQQLHAAGTVSDAAAALLFASLHEIKSTLEAFADPWRTHQISKLVLACLAAPGEADKLDKAERRLESLRTEVIVVANILQLKKSIFNERMELPQSLVGLARAKPILEFLQTSASEQLRAIGIHGLPGVGKTTLLNYIWQEASSSAPFAARAHIQIGQNAAPQICGLQSSMLQQLGGEQVHFTSLESGRQKLSEYFLQLKANSKPVFLAFDNVFDVEDLRKLLPFNLSKDRLPASSSIVVTCRDFAIIKAVLNICHLQEESRSQVLCFTPSCLSAEESKTVFASCGDLRIPEDAELLESLVPLCKGLPLALTKLGKLFAGDARRQRKEWEVIKEQMQVLDRDDAEIKPITMALQVSYDQLRESRKAAFLDVVNFFYGWPWGRVERILGVSVLNDLKNSSLILETDDWSKRNQSSQKMGRDIPLELMDLKRGAVTMHDLTLKFGESLHTLPVTIRRGFRSTRGLLQSLEAPSVRNLILWRESEEADLELEFLEKATSLQTLHLCEIGSRALCGSRKETLLKANYYKNVPGAQYSSRGRPQPLRMLRLESWKSSRIIMEMQLSCEIRELQLHDCEDVEQLPDTPLSQLEWLSIKDCKSFRGFSPSCVKNWCKLKYLEVDGCDSITSVPAELGHVENLRSVRFKRCERLKAFPSLCSAQGPSYLCIADCPSLRILPFISCPVERLELVSIAISNLALDGVRLRHIYLSCCPLLEVLPSSICNALSLEVLSVWRCNRLKELPSAIGNAASLREMAICYCESLAELPLGVGHLTSLRELDVSGCSSLKGLPPDVMSLKGLRVRGWKPLKDSSEK